MQVRQGTGCKGGSQQGPPSLFSLSDPFGQKAPFLPLAFVVCFEEKRKKGRETVGAQAGTRTVVVSPNLPLR